MWSSPAWRLSGPGIRRTAPAHRAWDPPRSSEYRGCQLRAVVLSTQNPGGLTRGAVGDVLARRWDEHGNANCAEGGYMSDNAVWRGGAESSEVPLEYTERVEPCQPSSATGSHSGTNTSPDVAVCGRGSDT